MDKKKVIELIESARSKVLDIEPTDTELTAKFAKAMNELNQAIKELEKPYWTSVKDELPPYETYVLVCNDCEPSDWWFSHRTCDPRIRVDKHNFANIYGEVTHWHRIEKLEEKK